VSAFQQRLVKLAKRVALLSAMWTAVCAVLIVGLQITCWVRNGVWDPYPLSAVISNRGGEFDASHAEEFHPAHRQEIVNWLLEVPTIVPLLLALALLFAFYIWLTTLEKGGRL
jgi:hypothetical protein